MSRNIRKKKAPQNQPRSQKNKSQGSLNSPLYDVKGRKVGEIELDAKLFDSSVNVPAMHQVMLAYNANRRSGTASTKTMGETRGGGKKPWRQKGTGRARAGSIRSPLWRGGGTVFGPHPRDYSYCVPAKLKKAALKSGLNSKLIEDEITVLDKIELEKPKTKLFKSILDALKIKSSCLVVMDSPQKNIMLASANLPGVSVKPYRDLNIVDILKHEKFLITESALKNLTKMLVAI